MPNLVLLRRSLVAAAVPGASSLQVGELAVNAADGKLFVKKVDNSVVEIGGGAGGVTGSGAVNTIPLFTGTSAIGNSVIVQNATNIIIGTDPGGADKLRVGGAVTATAFSGSGATLTALNASNLASGTVPTGRLGTGTANNTTFLRGDGTWTTPTAAAAPGGVTGNVQYNNGGVTDGAANLMATEDALTFLPLVSDPPIPGSGVTLYCLNVAGQAQLRTIRPSGIDTQVQDSLALNLFSSYTPGSGTAPSAFSTTATNVGTVSHPAPATTTLGTEIRRTVFTMANTAGSLASHRQNVLQVLRGTAAGRGGFRFVSRFKLDVLGTGNRGFFGLSSRTAAPVNVDPLTDTTDSKMGVAFNANTGNFTLIHNIAGTAPTQIALGASFAINTTDPYELILFSAPNGSTVGYRVRNLATLNSTTGTLSTNLPAAATFLAPLSWMTNNATTGTLAYSQYKWTLESDN